VGASSTDSAGIILNESRRMLRQISCRQLTTRSPIIRAIRWTMAPAAATMASMVTERIQSATIRAILWRTAPAAAIRAVLGTARTRTTMVGVVPLMARWLAYSSSFRTQSGRCLGSLPNEPCCRPFQLDYRQHIAWAWRVWWGRCHRGLFAVLFRRQHLAREPRFWRGDHHRGHFHVLLWQSFHL